MKLLRRTKIKIENRAGSAMGEPTRVELRFAVDATEAPLAYPDTPYPDPVEDLAVELSGPGLLATLIVPIGQARGWAADLFGAVSVAYREATGDPHALTNTELAALPPADRYQPGPGLLVVGDDTTPARVRFHIVLDVEGHCLDSASLRAAIVETLTTRFNSTRLAVSAGEPKPATSTERPSSRDRSRPRAIQTCRWRSPPTQGRRRQPDPGLPAGRAVEAPGRPWATPSATLVGLPVMLPATLPGPFPVTFPATIPGSRCFFLSLLGAAIAFPVRRSRFPVRGSRSLRPAQAASLCPPSGRGNGNVGNASGRVLAGRGRGSARDSSG